MDGIAALINQHIQDRDQKTKLINELRTISPPPMRGILSELQGAGVTVQKQHEDPVRDAIF